MMRAADRWRLAPLMAGEAFRRLRAGMRRATARLQAKGRVPERLLIVPPDLRTSDPTVAHDIYSGYFVFAGRPVATGGRTPFDVRAPSPAWAEALYGFGWLRHLRAAETALARANGRALVADFITRRKIQPAIAFEPRVAARRLISFLSHSPFVLDEADHHAYQRFMKGISRDLADLHGALPTARGEERLSVVIALAFAGLCLSEGERTLRRGSRLLEETLKAQVLPDGGHVTRNPAAIVDLLADLLPLRQAYAARAIEIPPEVTHAIDRMMPMLRLFRHGDGSLAVFNGMGLTQPDLIATLLAYDEARSSPILHAPHSGYERLQAGGAVVILDAGGAPPAALSRTAHAGALSFEFSAGLTRIVVNCGLPRGANAELRRLARLTAAHSTLVLGDSSSARFVQAGPGDPVLADARRAQIKRTTGRDGTGELAAVHEGYAERFGLSHERHMRLEAEGERLDGRDTLLGQGEARDIGAVLRFHLHPLVKPSIVGDGRTVLLALAGGEAWSFTCDAQVVALEESVFFAGPDGARRTEQIVVPMAATPGAQVRWSFARIGRAARGEGPRKAHGPISSEGVPAHTTSTEIADDAPGDTSGDTPGHISGDAAGDTPASSAAGPAAWSPQPADHPPGND